MNEEKCNRTDCIYYDDCNGTSMTAITQKELCLYENYSMYEEDC